jgi:hypothetical protein
MLAYEREGPLPNDVLNYKNTVRFLKAIPESREDIMENKSTNPLVSGLQKIFKGIDSSRVI